MAGLDDPSTPAERLPPSTTDSTPAARLREMDAQRKAIEEEAEAIATELTSPGLNGEPPVGIDAPLVDSEGFPRADVDLYNARRKRQRSQRADGQLHRDLLWLLLYFLAMKSAVLFCGCRVVVVQVCVFRTSAATGVTSTAAHVQLRVQLPTTLRTCQPTHLLILLLRQ